MKGANAKNIYENLNRTDELRTIYNWIKVTKNKNTIEIKKSPGRPRHERTKRFIRSIKEKLIIIKKKESTQALAKKANFVMMQS